jgi:hypothetical protein
MEVRACGCDFCRRQASAAVSDPQGRLEIACEDAGALRRYRFGHGEADYLSCAVCGVYLGAVTRLDDGLRGFILARVLDEHERFSAGLAPADFEGESRAERQARRRLRWTPTTLSWGLGASQASTSA